MQLTTAQANGQIRSLLTNALAAARANNTGAAWSLWQQAKGIAGQVVPPQAFNGLLNSTREAIRNAQSATKARVAASSPRARPAVVLGYYAGRSGLGGAGGVGVGSNGYGSTFDYGSALAGIQNAASYGNIDQAESHLASLTQILQNDLDANRITDGLGLQQAFAATASYVQQQAAPNVADANQARWAALVGQLQNNAAALNADIGYRNSQGTLADTTAGVVVDRSQGGDVNTYAGVSTAVYGGPGGTSIVSPGAFSNSAIYQAVGSGGVLSSPGAIADTVGTFAQTTAQGGATGDQNAPITFGNVLNSPGVQNLGGNLKLAFGQIPAWAWLAGLGLLVASRRR